MKLIETKTLYYQSGSSDKFYTVSIVEDADGSFSVPFTYGRRGSSGKEGYKLVGSTYGSATAIYSKVIREKEGKGYSKGPSWQVPLAAAAPAPTASTVKPTPPPPLPPAAPAALQCQLLDEIYENEVIKLITDTDICAQEKHDGRRRLMKYKDGSAYGFNKKGQTSSFILSFKGELTDIANHSSIHSFLLDGEEVGDQYYVFDMLEYDGKDIRDRNYATRYKMLTTLLTSVPSKSIHLVSTAFTTQEKIDLMKRLKAENKEGIVFKNLWAAFKPGHGTGDQWKFKFYATASCLVTKINTKRSVALGVYLAGNLVAVGNCTIPPNKDIPVTNSIVEIKYLYAYKGGSLYQPSYLGVRDDVDADECIEGQLKYKAA